MVCKFFSALVLLTIFTPFLACAEDEKRTVKSIISQFEKQGLSYPSSNSSGFSDKKSEMTDLIRRFGPIVYFHPQERYFPDSIESFANKAYVECFTEEKRGKKVKQTSVLRHDNDIPSTLKGLSQSESCIFALKEEEIKKKAYRGQSPASDGSITAPCYVHVFKLRPNYYILQFIYFYPYNGPTVGIGKLTLGTHEGDWEHMDVHIEKRNGDWTIARVHYAAHQQFKGGMYEPGKFPEENGHPLAYAAKYGHASLPRQVWLDGNLDTTKKSKYRWNCSENYKIFAVNGRPWPDDAWWANFKGRWGKTREGLNSSCCNSPTGPLEAKWFRRHGEKERSKFKTYDLIDKPDKSTGGVFMLSRPKKGTRSFVYEAPSRLNENFCVEFFEEEGDEEGISKVLEPSKKPIPNFKIIQKQALGLRSKALYRSEEAFPINDTEKYGRNFNYCFKRPKRNRVKNMSIVWRDEPASVPLVVKLTGFEF
ncbi:MAG: Vps62-related protein [Alphaproteobacteria bacterium]